MSENAPGLTRLTTNLRLISLLIDSLLLNNNFTNSNPRCLLKYSRHKTVLLCCLFSWGTQEKQRLMWTICRLCKCVCVEVTDRQRRTKWKGYPLKTQQHSSLALPQDNRQTPEGTEIEHQGWMYSSRYPQLLKLLNCCSFPFWKLIKLKIPKNSKLSYLCGIMSGGEILAEYHLMHNYPSRVDKYHHRHRHTVLN